MDTEQTPQRSNDIAPVEIEDDDIEGHRYGHSDKNKPDSTPVESEDDDTEGHRRNSL